MAEFMTAHQIGTVFERASGSRFPWRVESTRIILRQSYDYKLDFETGDIPFMLRNRLQQMQVGSAKVKVPLSKVTVR